jgi:hypothetical protein
MGAKVFVQPALAAGDIVLISLDIKGVFVAAF